MNDTPKSSHSRSDADKALERLLKETIRSMGDVPADHLPHMVRERLKGQLAADADIDRVLNDLRREKRQP